MPRGMPPTGGVCGQAQHHQSVTYDAMPLPEGRRLEQSLIARARSITLHARACNDQAPVRPISHFDVDTSTSTMTRTQRHHVVDHHRRLPARPPGTPTTHRQLGFESDDAETTVDAGHPTAAKTRTRTLRETVGAKPSGGPANGRTKFFLQRLTVRPRRRRKGPPAARPNSAAAALIARNGFVGREAADDPPSTPGLLNCHHARHAMRPLARAAHASKTRRRLIHAAVTTATTDDSPQQRLVNLATHHHATVLAARKTGHDPVCAWASTTAAATMAARRTASSTESKVIGINADTAKAPGYHRRQPHAAHHHLTTCSTAHQHATKHPASRH